MLNDIVTGFGLEAGKYNIQQLTSGLINNTWKVYDEENAYILQQINTHVFKSPIDITNNIKKLESYLEEHHADYLFVSLLPAVNGEYLLTDKAGKVFRLMPYVKDSQTLDILTNRDEAFEAARQFGRFTSKLSGFTAAELRYTLPDFHNLTLRFKQFEQAFQNAGSERLALASAAVEDAFRFRDIATTYESILKNDAIPLRVVHHDTKISNVLFDKDHCGLCVIDLDTVMPGYFFSDVGDMMRTYLSPANEEEKDFSKITIREDFFEALIEGYFSEMANALTAAEKNLIIYSGKFMIYMQALRFLSDFLNGDTYYTTSYPLHNLVRAQNQFILLTRYFEAEKRFVEIVHHYINEPLSVSGA